MLSPEKIQKNWLKHIEIVEMFITTRKDKVLNMLKDMEDHMVIAPASSKAWYHSAFPGGYIDHVNRVVNMSLQVSEMYSSNKGVIDFTEEELVFSALFHDLGKIGDGINESYLPQTDKWRREKLEELYTINPEVSFMLAPDRSLYLLQKNGIQLSEKEYIAIRTHDGVYDDSNKAYFISNSENSRMRTNIVNVLHTADYLASKIEYDIYKQLKAKK